MARFTYMPKQPVGNNPTISNPLSIDSSGIFSNEQKCRPPSTKSLYTSLQGKSLHKILLSLCKLLFKLFVVQLKKQKRVQTIVMCIIYTKPVIFLKML